MKHGEHRPKVKFGLIYLLIHKLNQKPGGHVLMIKFGKFEKKWTIQFAIPEHPVLTVSEQE
jgi:hypothetical protein